jgi:hypothetical protein
VTESVFVGNCLRRRKIKKKEDKKSKNRVAKKSYICFYHYYYKTEYYYTRKYHYVHARTHNKYVESEKAFFEWRFSPFSRPFLNGVPYENEAVTV